MMIELLRMPRRILLALCLFGFPLASNASLKVFACEPEWAALAQEIGAAEVDVFSATHALQDVHRIQARPSLIARLRSADLLICSGAELESGWLPLLLQRSANQRVQPGQPGYFMAAEQVERLDIPTQVDRAEGDVHASGNPHVHLDPKRMLSIAEALAQRLIMLDPKQADHYQTAVQNFSTRWTQALQGWSQQAAALQGRRVVVHHKDWRYLLDWLGMHTLASLEPKPGVPPSAAHLAKLKADMLNDPADLILRAAYQDGRAAQWLSRQTGIPVVELAYTVGGNDQSDNLFALFDDSLQKMLKAVVQ